MSEATPTMTVIHSSLAGASSVVISLHSYDPSGVSKSNGASGSPEKSKTDESSGTKTTGSFNKNVEALSSQEQQLVTQLESVDKRVKAHEMAHLLAAGGYARGGASYQYRQGPDGKKYAVAGEVQIDSGKGSSPENTISKMKTVRRAALAPADPSPQDRRVAAQAAQNIVEASQDKRLEAVARENSASKEDAIKNKNKSDGSSGSGGLSSPTGQKGSTLYASTSGRVANPPTLNIFA